MFVAVVVSKLEDQTVAFQGGLSFTESVLHLVVAGEVKLYEVSVDAAVYSPVLGSDFILTTYETAVLTEDYVRSSSQL